MDKIKAYISCKTDGVLCPIGFCGTTYEIMSLFYGLVTQLVARGVPSHLLYEAFHAGLHGLEDENED